MKKLLFVSTYFPPMASGGNARQLRFLRYLPEFGWEPTVITLRAKGPVPDPEGVRIVRPVTPSPDALYDIARTASQRWAGRRGRRLLDAAPPPPDDQHPAATVEEYDAGSLIADEKRYARRQTFNRWLFIPDPYVGWVPLAVAAGRKLAREQHYDAIVSSFPRPSGQLAAARLSRVTGLPWLADYRDPWPTHQFRTYKTRLHERAHFALERRTLYQAARATAVNQPIADDLLRRYPYLAGRVTVVPNGFDRAEDPEPVELGEGFWIVHTGRLYSRGRQAADLMDALREQDPDVRLLFLGVEGPRIRAYAEAADVADRVFTEPFVRHTRALGYQRAADGLLLVSGSAAESLSSKIFEYLDSGRPTFAMSPDGTMAAALLDEAGGGYRPAPDRPLADGLREFVARVRAGEIPPADRTVVDRYDGRVLTGRFAAVLDEMVATRQGAGRT